MLFDTKGHCFERDVIMLNVRWYLSYKLSYRDLEEMAAERGLQVDPYYGVIFIHHFISLGAVLQ